MTEITDLNEIKKIELNVLIEVAKLCEEQGFRYYLAGGTLIGALLFFIPRSIWVNKPIGTGATVFQATNQFYDFSNVAAPFLAEGYMNFGILGVAVFAFILGIVTKKMDGAYWQSKDLNYINIVYPFFMFMLFFVLRGDLMSGWAYTFAQLFVGYCVWKVIVRRTSGQNKTGFHF